MSDETPFDITYIRCLAEEFHDSQADKEEKTRELYNSFVEVILSYVKKCSPLTADETDALATLLTHPKKMVRTVAAIHLMVRGHAAAWPRLLEAAAPMFMPAAGDKEGWRNFWAASGAQSYLARADAEGKTLGLRPSLEEMEERWRLEDRPNYRLSGRLL